MAPAEICAFRGALRAEGITRVSSELQAFHQPPMAGRDRRRALASAGDIDMGVAALGGSQRRAGLERRDAIAHRAAPDFLDREANLDRVGKGEAGEIDAMGFDDEADDFARRRIEQAGLDQNGVHRRVEKIIIGRIVDMAVRVIVRPARRDGHEENVTVVGLQLVMVVTNLPG